MTSFSYVTSTSTTAATNPTSANTGTATSISGEYKSSIREA